MASSANIEYKGTSVELPKTLLDNPSLLKHIVSIDTWNQLSKENKLRLFQFLPQFPTNDTQEKKQTLKLLFSGQSFGGKNPVDKMIDKLANQELLPAPRRRAVAQHIVKERGHVRKLLRLKLKELQTILHRKKNELGVAVSEEEIDCLKRWAPLVTQRDVIEVKADDRFDRLMQSLESEFYCEDPPTDEESEEESVDPYSIKPDLALRRLTVEHKNKLELGVARYPELDTRGLTLTQILDREKKGRPQRGAPRGSGRGRRGRGGRGGGSSLASLQDDGISSDSSQHTPRSTDSVGVGMMGEGTVSPSREFSSFFSLLRTFFLMAPQRKLTSAQMEERVREWQDHQERSGINLWVKEISSWQSVTSCALRFLCAESGDFVPFVEHKPRLHLWRWLEDHGDEEETLTHLFTRWLVTRKEVEEIEEDEKIPEAWCPSDWTVRESTEAEQDNFQHQETERFANPWRSYVYYSMAGNYRSVVGPVRGANEQKDYRLAKARGHALLVNERPSLVNIVEIVRDAVARLPNGEGSRSDIVLLAMDSSFWKVTADTKQIQQCISSALDRLQCESTDPPVRYHAPQKLWIYRHRHRTPEEFERLHRQKVALEDAKRSRRGAAGPPSTSGAPGRGRAQGRDRSPWDSHYPMDGPRPGYHSLAPKGRARTWTPRGASRYPTGTDFVGDVEDPDDVEEFVPGFDEGDSFLDDFDEPGMVMYPNEHVGVSGDFDEDDDDDVEVNLPEGFNARTHSGGEVRPSMLVEQPRFVLPAHHVVRPVQQPRVRPEIVQHHPVQLRPQGQIVRTSSGKVLVLKKHPL